MERIKLVARRWPFAFSMVIFVLSFALLSIPVPSGVPATAVHEALIALAVTGVAVYVAVGGARALVPSLRGMCFGMRRFLYVFILCGILTLSTFLNRVSDGVPLSGTLAFDLPSFVLLCLAIGVFEEVLFRGLVFGGLLAHWGGTKKGLALAAVLSSLLFGVAHVIRPFIDGDVASTASLLQALGKSVQTGILGFAFAAVYVKTKSIAPAAIAHAAFDFIAELPTVVFSETLSAEYVSSDPSVAGSAAIGYLVVIVVLIPAVVLAAKTFKSSDVSFCGLFRDSATPDVPTKFTTSSER